MNCSLAERCNPEHLEDLQKFLLMFPDHFQTVIEQQMLEENASWDDLLEIVMDYGRPLVLRFTDHATTLSGKIDRADIDAIVVRLDDFADDNRAGIEGTLHRISAIRNRRGQIIGLTCRVGRAVTGTVESIRDLIESGESILFLGSPGRGKTTRLREAARVLSDDLAKRVVVVDTSNEIAGSGDIAHIGIGTARRMQVVRVAEQHVVMIEAVQNHFPEVIIIDEIGNEQEAQAARTIAERGVQLIATAHGNTLEDLLHNPALNDLCGGIQSVIVGDALMKAKSLQQKTVSERKLSPTFKILVEIVDRNTMVVHHDLAISVDASLREENIPREMRKVSENGEVVIAKAAQVEMVNKAEKVRQRSSKIIKIYPYGLGPERVEQAVHRFGPRFQLTRNIEEAMYVLARSKMIERGDQNLDRIQQKGAVIVPIRTNNYDMIVSVLQRIDKGEL